MTRNHRTQTKIALTTVGVSALVATSLMGGNPALAQSDDGGSVSATTQAAAAPKQLPTIEDTWSATWRETTSQYVAHPKLGSLEIRTYFHSEIPGTAPESGSVAYAVYQDGRPVGFMTDHAKTDLPLSNGPQFSVPDVTFVNTNADKEGNVYFISGTSVVMLSPTEDGYTSNHTLPGDSNKQLSDVKQITVSKQGIATITAVNETGETVHYTVKDSKLVPDAE